MRNLSRQTITLLCIIGCVYSFSCKKGDTNDLGPNPPTDTLEVFTPGPPPSSISFEPANLQNSFTLSFDYSEMPGKISVYLDDTTNTDPHDQLLVAYSLNDGYLEKTEYYTVGGAPAGGFTIQRSGSNITRLIMEHEDEYEGGLTKDTMNISFSDSSGYTNMKVAYGNYFDETVPVTIDYVFNKNKLVETKAGLFTSGPNSVFFPSFRFQYKSNGCIWLKESDNYYGTSFVYGDAGRGLDSLFMILGGKDAHLLEAVLYYDQYIGLFFSPLELMLSDNSVELNALVHRYGALQEVKSIPSGAEYPTVQTFTFQNIFDEEKRLVSSRIASNADLYATYSVKYK